MCGICGVLFNNKQESKSDFLNKMTRSMAHRGPDGEGFYQNNRVFLGHRRLSIIDLAGGSQPMFSDDRKQVVVFNGEIYNYREIKKELSDAGYSFRTDSDTEVLLKSYEYFGVKCLEKFIGMFAFAIYNSENHSLFVARDRLGIKPFYYARINDIFIFASEIKAIFASNFLIPEVNKELLDFYISTGYVPGEGTLFKSIKKLLPGHYGFLNGEQFTIKKYWHIEDIETRQISYNEAKDELLRLLDDSIRLRLISDVPVGVFLSGGVDSSAIVATITKRLCRKISTYSVGYSDAPKLSELSSARTIAKLFETDHHEFVLTHSDFFQAIDELLNHCEEPLVEPAAIALMQLSRLAKQSATVLLSGEGADEIFAGYPLYQIMPKVDKLRSIVPAKSLLAKIIGSCSNEKMAKYGDWLATPLANRYHGISNDVTPSIKRKIYKEGEESSLVTSHFHDLFHLLKKGSNLQHMQYVDIKTWLPDDLLLKADKMTMAASIELRVPFLDHRMVEFALSLPDSYKIAKNQGKSILKDAMREYLPFENLFQKKKGFPVPIAKWFREGLRQNIKDILLDQRTKQRGYFDNDYMEKIISLHCSGKQDLSRRIISHLILELWHRKYID